MKMLFLSVLLLFVACDVCEECRQSNNVVDNKVFIGGTKGYAIYSRKVDGGTLYEYHYNGTTYMQEARGFRVVFIPDSCAVVAQAPFGLE